MVLQGSRRGQLDRGGTEGARPQQRLLWRLVRGTLLQEREGGADALVPRRFADCFAAYGVEVDQVGAPVGGRPDLAEVEAALKKEKYAVLTFTHVDTSTGVLSDAKAIAEIVQRVSPGTLVVLDGVCSVASEEIRMDDWGIDVVSSLLCFVRTQKLTENAGHRSVPKGSQYPSRSFHHRRLPGCSQGAGRPQVPRRELLWLLQALAPHHAVVRGWNSWLLCYAFGRESLSPAFGEL